MSRGTIFIRMTMVMTMAGVFCMSYLFRKSVDPIPGLGPRLVHFQEERAIRWELCIQDRKIVCQKESNGAFSLLHPEPLRTIDSSEFFANVKNFNTLEYLSIVQKNVQDLSYWGIDGKRTYRLFLQNPQKVLEFQVGSFVKSFRGYYLFHNTDIYCVPSWIVEAIEKNPQELRQGYFLQKDVEQIVALRILSKNGVEIFIQKDGLYWKVNQILKESLDIPNIDRLIQDISYAKSEKVFCKPDLEFPLLWKELQSSKDQSIVSVVTCSDGTSIRFSLFKTDTQLYGIREDKQDIEVLPLPLYESLTKPIEFYLKK